LISSSEKANQTVFGQYNAADDDALFIIGNGTEDARSNAFVVYEDKIQIHGIDITREKLEALLALIS